MKKTRKLLMLAKIILFVSLIYVIQSCSNETDYSICSIEGVVIDVLITDYGSNPDFKVITESDTIIISNLPEPLVLVDYINYFGYSIPIKFNYKKEKVEDKTQNNVTCLEFNYNCSTDAEIIDYNPTECLCCPGWIINVGGDTIKVNKLPFEKEAWSLVETSGFPIQVQLDYTDFSDTVICKDFYKKITCISLKN